MRTVLAAKFTGSAIAYMRYMRFRARYGTDITCLRMLRQLQNNYYSALQAERNANDR